MSVSAHRNLRFAMVLALVALCAIGAGPAWGATAEVDALTGTLVITGTAANEVTQVDHSFSSAGPWEVRTVAPVGSPAVGTTAGDGCQPVTANPLKVTCTSAGVNNVHYNGGDGDNTFDLGSLHPSKILGSVELYGGDGRDFFSVLTASGDVYAELGGGNDLFGTSAAHIPPVEVYGQAGADMLQGTANDDTFDAGADQDRVEGKEGDDEIQLGAGNDVAEGDEGDDVIRGGSGNDKLAGGANNDDLYGDAGQDEFGSDHNHNTGFTLISSTPGAPPQGNDDLFLREAQPEQDFVYAGGFSNPPVQGGCSGGNDYVEADSLDVVPLNVGCETIDRPGTPAALSFTPAEQAFGQIQVGFNSIVRAFTLTNSGDMPSAAVQTALSGANAGEFEISASDCPQGRPLPGHTFCTVGIRFSPLSAGLKGATLTVAGLATQLSGTGHQPSPDPQPSPAPQPGTGQQPGAGPAPTGPAAGADVLAPLIADLTKAVQRIAQAIRGKFVATISTNESGTWKVQVFGRLPQAGAARRALLAGVTTTVDGAGNWRVKVPFKAAAKTRLKRLRMARLQVRSTFTDTSGNTRTITRTVTLRR
jgi:hypothetical protein